MMDPAHNEQAVLSDQVPTPAGNLPEGAVGDTGGLP